MPCLKPSACAILSCCLSKITTPFDGKYADPSNAHTDGVYPEFFVDEASRLAEKVAVTDGRLRLQVVRKSEGKYTPDENNECVWWMELEELSTQDYTDTERTGGGSIQRPLHSAWDFYRQ